MKFLCGLRTGQSKFLLGLAAAAGVSRVLGFFLVGVEPRNPVVFAGVTLLVIGIGMFATWWRLGKRAGSTRWWPCAPNKFGAIADCRLQISDLR